MQPLGAAAAFATSVTWAFAATRYARAAHETSASRVNLQRALVVLPIYLLGAVTLDGRAAFSSLTPAAAAWLSLSVLCSYALADNLFFVAAKRLGTPTALALASSYPLWAALVGAAGGEPFGPARLLGTLLCTGGVVGLVLLGGSGGGRDLFGLALAFITSVLWAGNSIAVKHGAAHLDAWEANAIRYAVTLLLLGSLRVARRGWGAAPSAAPSGGWRALLPAILIDALLGSLLYVYGLSHTDLAIGVPLSSLAPLISVPFARRAGEAALGWRRLGAVGVTVAGAAVLLAA